MNRLIRKIEQWMCSHPPFSQIRRYSDGRIWVECMDCGHHSRGVEV